ncbi:MAG: MraY family glycosyltransferase, partial [Flavobacteriales bacterium]
VRWSKQPKPTIGGVGMMISYLIGGALLFLVFGNSMVLFLSIPLFLAAIVGLIDDLKAVKAMYKLVMQVICGLLLYSIHFGFHTPMPDFFDCFLTVFWTVLIMNSINMLDNMDGISGAVSLVSFIILAVFFNMRQWLFPCSMVHILFALISLGFLLFNKPTSRMFMGDAGSQFLGVALAAGTMLFMSTGGLMREPTKAFWCMLVLLLPALADTGLVVVNRIRFKTSPFIGGRDHSTHNFAYLGMSGKGVFWLFAGLSTVGALLVYKIQTSSTNLFLYISVTYVVVYLMLIFKASSINLKNNKYTYKP